MNLKLKHFFIIFSILLFAIQVQADAPISYNKELASDVELRGTFLQMIIQMVFTFRSTMEQFRLFLVIITQIKL